MSKVKILVFLNLITSVFLAFAVYTAISTSNVKSYNLQSSAATLPTAQISEVPLTVSIPETTQIPLNAKIMFTGDVMLGRTIETQILKGLDPFFGVKEKLKEADYRVVNLECSVTDKGAMAINKLFTLKSNPKTLKVLTNTNINLVSLANNHTLDYGPVGLMDMINNLDSNNIKYFGAGKDINTAFQYKMQTINGYRIAFLGFNDVETYYTSATDSKPGNASIHSIENENKMLSMIKEARQNADIVIPYLHWGTEYSITSNNRQITLAHKIIDAGADIVIGSHPHVIENVEDYNGKKIYYSLGNFIFDEMQIKPNATDGDILEMNIYDKKIINTKLLPIHINSKGFPELKNIL